MLDIYDGRTCWTYDGRAQATLEKQARQLDVMKAGAPVAGPGATRSRGRALKAERLEKSMKTGVFRELTAIRWKQAFVVRAASPTERCTSVRRGKAGACTPSSPACEQPGT